MRSTPWEEGKGDQEDYHDSILLWHTYHSSIPDVNSNKITVPIQAIYLKYQLSLRSKDLCTVISNNQLLKEDYFQLIVK